MTRKKKIKIRKRNFIIFTLFIMLLIFSITEIGFLIVKLITTSDNTDINNEKTKEKTSSTEKLDVLENIDKKIDYFNKEYIERYISYKKKNPSLSIEQVIKNVNMNLDLTFYEDIKEARNIDTEKVLVNKYYYLDDEYVPNNLETISNQYSLNGMKLVDIAKDAFEEMAKAAKKEGLTIIAMSSYRSYDYQVNLYNRYVKEDGKVAADTYSGRPGHSEHQTGLAVDVYNKEKDYTNFDKTDEYNWMLEHAHEYGFILRFPKDKENETGYQFESWHYRYVGKKAAKEIKEKNISFEEYYATVIKDW